MAEVMAAPKIEPTMQLTPPQSSPQQQQQHSGLQSQAQPPSQHDSPQSFDGDMDEADDKITPLDLARPGIPMHPNPSRRPPRKSTLTQQQKNQKRQRATQEQLVTLEVEFNKNPTPTAVVRERIAQDINMTERSVQIWFQNRRAKIKNIAKRTIENGEDCDNIPDSMRRYLHMQNYGPGPRGFAPGMMGRNGTPHAPYGNPAAAYGTDLPNARTQIQHFSVRSLSIGSWRRVTQSSMDLVVFYSPDKACVTYYINNESAGYKIEYPFSSIKSINLDNSDQLAPAEGVSQRLGGLIVELNRPPKFYMDNTGHGGFYECGDFTEARQASQIMTHHLSGPSKTLSGQLAKMISLEAYQNRGATFEMIPFAMSAPVSPMRPASQPNHLIHPHHPHAQVQPQIHAHAPAIYQPGQPIGLMGPPAPRGHKRQRSRSVPAAIDVSMLRTAPMPSFLIQHEGHPAQHFSHDPNMFTPMPQHLQAHPGFAPGFASAPGNLSIDTASAYHHMPVNMNGPMSVTAVNTPSEFGTPGFFMQGAPPEHVAGPHFAPQFSNGGFLSAVDPSNMIGTSNTPLSVANGDPVIANHSPPNHGPPRSQSADIFGPPGDHNPFADDGLFLSETFDKTMRLPFRSPMPQDGFHSPMGDMNFNFHASTPMPNGDVHVGMQVANQARSMSFDCGSTNQDGSVTYGTPAGVQNLTQSQNDSGVSFSTPTQMTNEQNGLVQDSRLYSSPGQMMQLTDEQSLFHQSPLDNGITLAGELDLDSMAMFIDPHNLGPQH